MKKLFTLCLLLLPCLSFCQETRSLIELYGGRSRFDIVDEATRTGTIHTEVSGMDGYYVGAGYILSGKRGVGVKMKAGLEHMNIDVTTHTMGSYTVAPGVETIRKGVDFIVVAPCFSLLPVAGPVTWSVSLGLPVKFPVQQGYIVNAAAELQLGVGYKGLLIHGGAQVSLGNFMDTRPGDGAVEAKASSINFGVTLIPQLFFAKAKAAGKRDRMKQTSSGS